MGLCGSKEPTVPIKTTTQKRQVQKKNLEKSSVATTTNVTSGSSNDSSEKSPENQQLSTSSSDDSKGKKEVKVLLLGSGESGKSTIVKQMKILHQNGYSKEELYEYKPFVYKNILDCIKNVINAIIELEPELIKKDKIESIDEVLTTAKSNVVDYQDLKDILDYEYNIDPKEIFSPEIALKIKKVYNTIEVKNFVKIKQSSFNLIDSTDYFLSDLDRIAKPTYLPLVADILRTRKKTSGIFDFRFEMGGGLDVHMYDVGGQRSERKKWIHCFDNVTLIIFCVALSEYDQVLLEENSQNRLEESLTLFDSVINSRWFARTSIVLFLNKIDVFAEKIPYSPLENHFTDYNGGNNINKAAKYILWRFTQVNRSGLNIYPHVTQATDTSNIQLVFAAVKETILENSLRDSGIL